MIINSKIKVDFIFKYLKMSQSKLKKGGMLSVKNHHHQENSKFNNPAKITRGQINSDQKTGATENELNSNWDELLSSPKM